MKGGRTAMHAKAFAARAEGYARLEGGSPSAGLIAALIDLFTVRGEGENADAEVVRAAWDRLAHRLDDRTRLREQLALTDGVELLAANLLEAGDADRAAVARQLFPPVAHPAPEPEPVGEPVPSFAPDSALWVAQPAL